MTFTKDCQCPRPEGGGPIASTNALRINLDSSATDANKIVFRVTHTPGPCCATCGRPWKRVHDRPIKGARASFNFTDEAVR